MSKITDALKELQGLAGAEAPVYQIKARIDHFIKEFEAEAHDLVDNAKHVVEEVKSDVEGIVAKGTGRVKKSAPVEEPVVVEVPVEAPAAEAAPTTDAPSA